MEVPPLLESLVLSFRRLLAGDPEDPFDLEDPADRIPARILMGGSRSLGVHTPDSDYDLVLAVRLGETTDDPVRRALRRWDPWINRFLFQDPLDPTALVYGDAGNCPAPERLRFLFTRRFPAFLRSHESVRSAHSIEALVPIVDLTVDGLPAVDLMLAVVPEATWPDVLNAGPAGVLGCDVPSALSLGGPRTAEAIFKLLAAKDEDVDEFRALLRALRAWAKARGLYEQRLGLLGGVQCAVATAAGLLAGHRDLASLLRFLGERPWGARTPLMLEPPGRAVGFPALNALVYCPFMDLFRSDPRMPLLVPVFPAVDALRAVTLGTRSVLVRSFQDGPDAPPWFEGVPHGWIRLDVDSPGGAEPGVTSDLVRAYARRWFAALEARARSGTSHPVCLVPDPGHGPERPPGREVVEFVTMTEGATAAAAAAGRRRRDRRVSLWLRVTPPEALPAVRFNTRDHSVKQVLEETTEVFGVEAKAAVHVRVVGFD